MIDNEEYKKHVKECLDLLINMTEKHIPRDLRLSIHMDTHIHDLWGNVYHEEKNEIPKRIMIQTNHRTIEMEY